MLFHNSSAAADIIHNSAPQFRPLPTVPILPVFFIPIGLFTKILLAVKIFAERQFIKFTATKIDSKQTWRPEKNHEKNFDCG